jgi:hypothetical protein
LQCWTWMQRRLISASLPILDSCIEGTKSIPGSQSQGFFASCKA